jgi:oligoendopeptidase F
MIQNRAMTTARHRRHRPRWDLSRLYPGTDSQALKDDLENLRELAYSFEGHYRTTVAYMRGEDLGLAIGEYEEILRLSSKISSYLSLLEVEDINNFSKTEKIKTELAAAGKSVDFF